MTMSLGKLLFFPSLLVSLFISMSASSVILAWVGLEMNMVSVVPLLSLSVGNLGGEVSMKYFLAQAWASSVFLVGVLWSQINSSVSVIMELALLVKLGAGPLHLWFVSVMRKCSFESLFILSTVQKVIPLTILQTVGGVLSISVGVVASSLVAGFGVFNHSSLRLILGYSSIFTVAWCLGGIKLTSFSWFAYLSIYSLSLWALMFWIEGSQVGNVSQLYSSGVGVSAGLAFFLGMASMGGLPPLTGFWAKLIILGGLLSVGNIGLSLILLTGTVWLLYLYMRVSFLSGGQGSTSGAWQPSPNGESLFIGLVVISLLPGIILLGLFLLSGVIT